MTRSIAVVGTAQTRHTRSETVHNEVEMLMPVIEASAPTPASARTTSASPARARTDYLAGQAFSFVMTLDGVGPWPPIQESHVEMDGAWALYEAWVKMQLGEVDTALVYGYGKSSPGPLHEVLTRQLDPYNVAPLWPDAISLAALQARALLDLDASTDARSPKPIWPRWRLASRNGSARQPPRPAGLGPAESTSCSPRPAARPAPPARLPAHHRRRRGRDPRRRTTPPASCATGPHGSAASTTASTRWRSGVRDLHRALSTAPGRRAGRRGRRPDRRRRAPRAVHATRS